MIQKFNIWVTCLLFFLLLIGNSEFLQAQPPLPSEIADTAHIAPLVRNVRRYFFAKSDSALFYSNRILSETNEDENYPAINFALQLAGEAYRGKGDFPNSLKMQFTALRMNQRHKDQRREAYSFSFIGFTYLQAGLYEKALEYCLPALQVLASTDDWIQRSFMASNTAYCYIKRKQPDSALYYNKLSLKYFDSIGVGDNRKRALRTLIYDRFGTANEEINQLDKAVLYYRTALFYCVRDSILVNLGHVQSNLANVFKKQGKMDSAIYFARSAMKYSGVGDQDIGYLDATATLADIYEKSGMNDSALRYMSISANLRDSMYGSEKFKDLLQLTLSEQERYQKLEGEKTTLRNRLKLSLVAVIGVAFLGFALILLRNNRAKQKMNLQLNKQKNSLELTLSQLKATQSQLIQSEKMASLGELTAGIAHEIQNPLNFVNNFSDVNTELVNELRTANEQGEKNDVELLALQINENNEKIIGHGQRADSIVKSMLQHSRISSGQAEETNINALCDEYLRLSFHGMRAKDKSFNATLKTEFDPTVGKIKIIPQDLGRVLLNLYNNAFYAVREKEKMNANNYRPEVTVSTRKIGDKVRVEVGDNGAGIPENIKDKIFQPFFTTKPTGQGTGLGLSMSYDIVKAHGGEIRVNSREDMGTTFVIEIPMTT